MPIVIVAEMTGGGLRTLTEKRLIDGQSIGGTLREFLNATQVPIVAKLFILPHVAAISFAYTIWTSHAGTRAMAASAEQILQQGQRQSLAIQCLTSNFERSIALVRGAPSTIDLTKLAEELAEFNASITELQATFPEENVGAEADEFFALEMCASVGRRVFDDPGRFALQDAIKTVEGPFAAAVADVRLQVDEFQMAAGLEADILMAGLRLAEAETNRRVVLSGLLALAAVVGRNVLVARNLSHRIMGLRSQMSRIAGGVLEIEIMGSAARDAAAHEAVREEAER